LLLLNNQIVQATGTLQLKASFPNPADRLWPGELVNVRLLIDSACGRVSWSTCAC